MDRSILTQQIKELMNASFPPETFRDVFQEDDNSYTNYFFVIDDHVGVWLTVDLMDKFLSLDMVRLNNGKLYEGNGYLFPQKGRCLRLWFFFIALYFDLPIDRKRVNQLSSFKNYDAITSQLEKNLQFYAPVVNNEKNIVAELHRPETWEKIDAFSERVRI